MKKYISLAALFIVSFLAFTVYQLPASVALQLGQSQLPKNVRLGSVTGSLWQGQISEVRIDRVQVFDVRWQLNSSALLMGQLQGKLNWGNSRDNSQMSGKTNFAVSLFNQQAELEKATMRFNVEQLMSQLNLPLPVRATGRVIFDIDSFVSGKPYCEQLKGEVFSPEIKVEGLSGWFSIGELAGDLGCKSGDVAVVVQPDNLLGLQADAVLADKFQFRVAGNVKPDATLPKEVHDAVKFLGRPDAEGRYPVNL